jgi:hypothetical protein
MMALDGDRLGLIRRVAGLFAMRPDFRQYIKVEDENGEAVVICALPTDSAGYLFDLLESRGGAGNVVVPAGDALHISYWTCAAVPLEGRELIPCSDDSTVEMLLACIQAADSDVSFERHAGMRIAGSREFSLVA